MEAAKHGFVTEEMKIVAKKENVPVLSLTLNMKIGVWELFILKIYIVICL